MHAVLRRLRTGRRLSHVFVADLVSYHKLLFVTDAAINISPDLMQKAAIIQNAVDLRASCVSRRRKWPPSRRWK
jgi:phosphotransacetylase